MKSDKILGAPRRRRWSRDGIKLMLMALPFVAYVVAFSYVPLLGWGLAFTNYKPGRALEQLEFVGLKYFKLIGYYWSDIFNALINTLALSLLSILAMAVPLLFAICLNEIRRAGVKKLVQTASTLPHFISWVIVYSLCFGLFSTDGMINNLLLSIGAIKAPMQLFANRDTAWIFMTVLDIWKEVGWSAIIYLAALAGIDAELYEAARIDGAGRLACARYITLPGLMPTFSVLLLLKIGSLLSVGLEKYLMFSNPVTIGKLEVLDMFTYRVGIGTQDFSFATAVSIIKSLVSVVLLTLANLLAKRHRGEGIL